MVNLGFTEQEKKMFVGAINSGWPHCFTNAEEDVNMEVNEWIRRGRPHVLSVVARIGNYTAALDTGYGRMFLLDTATNEMAQTRHHTATLNKAVFLDKEYYGTKHWLYIAEEVEDNATLHADNDGNSAGLATD